MSSDTKQVGRERHDEKIKKRKKGSSFFKKADTNRKKKVSIFHQEKSREIGYRKGVGGGEKRRTKGRNKIILELKITQTNQPNGNLSRRHLKPHRNF